MPKVLGVVAVVAASAASFAGSGQALAACQGEVSTARVCVVERSESGSSTRYDYAFVESSSPTPYGYVSAGASSRENDAMRAWSVTAPYVHASQSEHPEGSAVAGTTTVWVGAAIVSETHGSDGCTATVGAGPVGHRQDCAGLGVPFVELPQLP